MRILLVIQDWIMPSSRVRTLNLVPELEKAGLSCEVNVYPHGLADKLRLFFSMPRYDAVLLQKKLPTPVDSFLIRRFCKKLLFDFDDAIHLKHESGGDGRSRSREVKAKGILSRADHVVAGNRILKDFADQHNGSVSIVPSSVEVSGVPTRDHAASADPVVIGWVGGNINLGHLKSIGTALKNLSEKYSIALHIVCDQSIDLPGVDVKHIPWALETQADEIARFDIGIMPLPQSKHAEGKCGYKALQCMAAGVPVVVSDVGVNGDIVGDGEEGFVVADEAGFEAALEKLIQSQELRAEMGHRARKKAEQDYAIEVAGRKLAELIQKCCR